MFDCKTEIRRIWDAYLVLLYFDLMKQINGGTQMKDVWNLPAIAPWEKSCGKHPTQKPLALLTRIILASTQKNAWVLDPFTGSSTTGIAANLVNRKFLGIDREEEFLTISKNRKLELENPQIFGTYKKKLGGFNDKNQLDMFLASEPTIEYERKLTFNESTVYSPSIGILNPVAASHRI